jgi:hypothetical protein
VMSGPSKAEGEQDHPADERQAARARLFLVGSAAAATLALSHFLINWTLFTDALVRRFLF